jgi:hypothetical protein
MDPSPSELYSALITGPRRAFVPQPDTKVIDRPGWFQLLTPSFRQGGLNEVHWAILPEDQGAPVVAETIADYQRHQLQWRWTVGPDSGPSGLSAELARVGGGRGVVRDVVPPGAAASSKARRHGGGRRPQQC